MGKPENAEEPQTGAEVRRIRGVTQTGSVRLRAQPNDGCFACGPGNPRGLHLHFESTGCGEIAAEWLPDSAWEGFRGIVHGGIVSTVLDEAMSKAVAASRIEALTVELRVRLRHNVAPARPLRVRAWIDFQRRRVTRAEATLTSADGTEFAHAWGTFLALHDSGSPTVQSQTT